MSTESVSVLLFIVATAAAMAVRHWPVPYAVGLVLAGLVLGIFQVLPVPQLTRSLLFTIFLPVAANGHAGANGTAVPTNGRAS